MGGVSAVEDIPWKQQWEQKDTSEAKNCDTGVPRAAACQDFHVMLAYLVAL